MIIVDVQRPEHPVIDQVYNANGTINDLNDVKLGMTDASVFGYLADGKNGLKVVQMISPGDAGLPRLLTASGAGTGREVPDARSCVGDRKGPRSRSRGG